MTRLLRNWSRSFSTLRGRMLALAVPLVTLSFGGLVGILDQMHSTELHEQLRLEMERTARVSSQMLAAPLWYVNLAAVAEGLRVLLEHPYIEVAVARNVDGKVVVRCVRPGPEETGQPKPEKFQCQQQGQRDFEAQDEAPPNGWASHVQEIFFKPADVHQLAGEIEIYFTESRVEALMNRRLRRDAIFFVLLVLSVLAGILFATRRAIVTPLQRWRQAMRSSHDEGLQSVNWISGDEIGELIREYNERVGEERKKLSEATGKLKIYEGAFESLHCGFCIFDRDCRLMAFNQRYLEMLDYSAGSVEVGMSLKTLLRANSAKGEYGSASVDAIIIDRLAIASSNQPYRRERERPSGALLEVVSSPIPEGGFVSIYTDITARKAFENQMRQMTLNDATTGLAGRALFHDRLRQALALADRSGGGIAIFLTDIDEFQRLNQTHGQDVADLILREMGDRLRGIARKSDTVARFEGDQFAIIQHGLESMDDAALLAHRMLGAASRPFEVAGQSMAITISIGVTLYPDDDRVSRNILKNAQLALTAAKAEGHPRYRFFVPEVHHAVIQRGQLEEELFNGLREKQFLFHYQPRIDLVTGALVATEAQIRWLHPAKGLLLPEDFMELVADRGLLAPLVEWMLAEAFRQRLKWRRELSGREDQENRVDRSEDGWRVTVPLPLTQFEPGHLATRVGVLFDKTPFEEASPDRHLLEVKISTDALLPDPINIVEELRALREMGVRLMVENFGNGRSPLQSVRKLAIDGFQLDHQLIRDLVTDAKTAAVVQALIRVGQELGLRVSAAEVDTPELLRQLRDLGCHEAQGKAICPPMTSEEFLAWLADQNA